MNKNFKIFHHFTLKGALDIQEKEVISLVGAGGKTTLMFALAGELTKTGKIIITTTTTKIFTPTSSQSPFYFLSSDENIIEKTLLSKISNYQHITIASEKIAESGKLKGIPPSMITRLSKIDSVSHIIIEADGAAKKPLKAPASYEPVIPESTTLVVAVVGLDTLGCPLDEKNVFRPEIVCKLTDQKIGSHITEETIATVITHPSGILKGSPLKARIMVFLNKTDRIKDHENVRRLAENILKKRAYPIERVVLGQAKNIKTKKEVVSLLE
ncbi:MAG: selenium cofactor biosynthesis protein YqeC [Thermodesulfobacteriota bacterium]|nr:selenium cofactor biosynthesis protein YqeC [Thermodesulfobacteriota bacterium]